LPGNSSLAKLLAKHRGKRNPSCLPPLSPKKMLTWADKHRHRTNEWPIIHSGPILDAPGETWSAIQNALVLGLRGLPGGSSLPQLLAEHRGVRNPSRPPKMTKRKILTWADAHFQRTGKWPSAHSGPIVEAPGETWRGVDRALADGGRGFPGGSSLSRLLDAHRPDRDRTLSIEQILRWADMFHKRTGKWPTAHSGAIGYPAAGTWRSIAMALFQGGRGLQKGNSLARLLAERRGR